METGMVVAGDELHVRAYRGGQSGWYRAAREHGDERIRAGAVHRNVLLQIRAEIGPADAIDAAYQAKYQQLGMTEVAKHGDGNIKITMRFTRPRQ
jgi:hypothetical protein